MKKIIFNKPYIIESDLDGVQILYPFTLISSNKQISSSIIVTITGHISYQLGFQIWQFEIPRYYDNLISILFKYVELKIIELKKSNFNVPEQRIGFSNGNCVIDPTLGPSLDDIDGKEIIL